MHVLSEVQFIVTVGKKKKSLTHWKNARALASKSDSRDNVRTFIPTFPTAISTTQIIFS